MQESVQSPDRPNSIRTEDQPQELCPWWVGYLLASPIRKLFERPDKMLAASVRPGMVVLEPGPGMGFFTLELAKMVGNSGMVIAVDIQPKMLDGLRRRVARAGLLDSVEIRQSRRESLGLSDLKQAIDFTLAAAVVHEMPSADWFFSQAGYVSKFGARLLLMEPKGHVTAERFQNELRAANNAGFTVVEPRGGRRSYSVLLEKTGR
jgi:ubiquinone/menaquinone biosynthesis C-methylase UbiE